MMSLSDSIGPGVRPGLAGVGVAEGVASGTDGSWESATGGMPSQTVVTSKTTTNGLQRAERSSS